MKCLRFAIVLLLAAAGCARTSVSPVANAPMDVEKPDFFIVHDFAASADAINIDSSFLEKIGYREIKTPQTEEAQQVGRMVSEALAVALVDELKDAGIAAYRANDAPAATGRTASIRGFFETIDEGDRTKRVLVGFGLGSSEVQTHFLLSQGVPGSEQLIGEATTVSKGSLKPGMLITGAAGAARDAAGRALAVGAATTAASEKFVDNVQADAKRSAKEAAERIIRYYKSRDWL